MNKRGLHAGFERWRDCALEKKYLKAKTLKLVLQSLNGFLVSGFERWRDHTCNEGILQHKVLRVVRRFLNSALVLTFDKLRCNALDQLHIRDKIAKVVLCMISISMITAFLTWKCRSVLTQNLFELQTRRYRKMLQISLRGWRGRKLHFQELHEWKCNFLATRIFNCRSPLRSTCFHSWMMYVAQCRYCLASSLQAFRHKSRTTQLRSFVIWSKTSALKQIGFEVPTHGTDVSFESLSFLTKSSPSSFQMSKRDLRRSQNDEDFDCVQRALLSSYQRLDSERLRRRVVLGWAAIMSHRR